MEEIGLSASTIFTGFLWEGIKFIKRSVICRAWSYREPYDHSDSEELFGLSDQMGGFKKNDFVGDVTGGRRQDVSAAFPGCYEKCFYKFVFKVFFNEN